jgi:hypothetical protein
MARQRAEARLGLALLVAGFGLQAVGFLAAPSLGLHGAAELLTAGVLVAGVWAGFVVAWKTYVPWDERRTIARMPDAPGLYVRSITDSGSKQPDG